MTVVVRHAFHHIDVGTLPLASGTCKWDYSGRWLGGYIEEIAPAPTKSQYDYLLRIAEARECNIEWRRGYRAWFGEKKKECMFKESG